jgi:hypothetical protein
MARKVRKPNPPSASEPNTTTRASSVQTTASRMSSPQPDPQSDAPETDEQELGMCRADCHHHHL